MRWWACCFFGFVGSWGHSGAVRLDFEAILAFSAFCVKLQKKCDFSEICGERVLGWQMHIRKTEKNAQKRQIGGR